MEYKKYALEFAKGTIGLISGGTIGWVVYNGLLSNTLEDVTVTSIGTTHVDFYHQSWMVFEPSPTMRVDKFNNCLRGYEIDRQNIKVGEKLQRISYRSPLVAGCDILTEIIKK